MKLSGSDTKKGSNRRFSRTFVSESGVIDSFKMEMPRIPGRKHYLSGVRFGIEVAHQYGSGPGPGAGAGAGAGSGAGAGAGDCDGGGLPDSPYGVVPVGGMRTGPVGFSRFSSASQRNRNAIGRSAFGRELRGKQMSKSHLLHEDYCLRQIVSIVIVGNPNYISQ